MMTATSLRLRLCSSRREKRYSSLLCRLTQHRSFLFYFIYIFPSLVVVAIVVWKHGRYTRCTQRGALTLFSTLRNEWRPPTGSHRFSLYWTRSSPRCHGRWGECISPHTPPASVAPLLLIPFCRKRERATIALNHLRVPFLYSSNPQENTILCVLAMHITRRSRVCMIGHAEPASRLLAPITQISYSARQIQKSSRLHYYD
jgi:hypothetical protein